MTMRRNEAPILDLKRVQELDNDDDEEEDYIDANL